MRKLLELLAEPAIAQRDAKLRDKLREIVGTSAKMQKSIFLMDGSHTQGQIATKSSMDQSNLSKMVRKMDDVGLLIDDKKHPRLAISIPVNFFDTSG
jgi:hypothetical protein